MPEFMTMLFPLFMLAMFILFSGIFTVKQQTAVVVERFGKFHSIRQSGLHFKIPVLDKIAGKVSLKIQQLGCNGGNENQRQRICQNEGVGSIPSHSKCYLRCLLQIGESI